MFLSRIRAAAAPAGVEVHTVRAPDELVAACRGEPPALVVLDLDSPSLPALAAVRALRAEPATSGVTALGFYSHVHPERGREALEAGCSRALPRSVFVQELARLLAPPRR